MFNTYIVRNIHLLNMMISANPSQIQMMQLETLFVRNQLCCPDPLITLINVQALANIQVPVGTQRPQPGSAMKLWSRLDI